MVQLLQDPMQTSSAQSADPDKAAVDSNSASRLTCYISMSDVELLCNQTRAKYFKHTFEKVLHPASQAALLLYW